MVNDISSVKEISIPRAAVPPKLDMEKMEKPKNKITDVYIMLNPVSLIAALIAPNGSPLFFFNSCRYLVSRYMVPSDAIPNAMLKIKMVEGLKRIFKNPIIPAVITNGIRQGNLDKIMMLTERNRAIPTMAISIISIKRLSNKLRSK